MKIKILLLIVTLFAWSLSKMETTITWNPLLVSPDGITVAWQEKYGTEKSENCIGIWENNSQYLLTWKDEKKVYIEKSNVNSIRFTRK